MQRVTIHNKNIKYLEEKIKTNIQYLYSLKTVKGQYLWKSKRKTFVLGFAAPVKSTLPTANDLLKNHNFKYILTYKFSQDALVIFLVLCEENLDITTIQIVCNSNMHLKAFYCIIQ